MGSDPAQAALKDDPNENQPFRRGMENPAQGLPLSPVTLPFESLEEFRARKLRQDEARRKSERAVFIPLPPLTRRRRPQ